MKNRIERSINISEYKEENIEKGETKKYTRGIIPNRVCIEQRLEVVEERKYFWNLY